MRIKHYLYIISFLFIVSCSQEFTPKPRAYYRITFPDKEYISYNESPLYKFEYPIYGRIVRDTGKFSEAEWINIEFPQYKGKIHISYKNIYKNIDTLLNDAHLMAYKHAIKADAIDEKIFENTDNKVYGLLYDIKGNAASSVQFFVTDSTKHYLRGALYFNSIPNKDSLAPVVAFFKSDIIHLIETIRWK